MSDVHSLGTHLIPKVSSYCSQVFPLPILELITCTSHRQPGLGLGKRVLEGSKPVCDLY